MENAPEGLFYFMSRPNLTQLFFECGIKIPTRQAGVYIIGDFYIGSSGNIKNRIKNHIYTAFNGRMINYNLKKAILSAVSDKSLTITILSPDKKSEYLFIKDFLSKGYPLLNQCIENNFK